HSDQGYPGKIEALSDHLGADQNIDGAGTQTAKERRARFAASAGVAVHPRDPRARQQRGERASETFGAETLPFESRAAAFRTSFGSRRALAAEVASQAAVAQMERQADAAIAAGDDVPTQMALQEIVITAAIEKDDTLPAGFKIGAERLEQRRRKRYGRPCGSGIWRRHRSRRGCLRCRRR